MSDLNPNMIKATFFASGSLGGAFYSFFESTLVVVQWLAAFVAIVMGLVSLFFLLKDRIEKTKSKP